MLVFSNSESVNEAIVTLQEKQLTTSSIYLFEVMNNQTKNCYSTIAFDSSLTPDRYQDLYIYNATGSANPFSSSIDLPLYGFYTYYIYENPNSVTSSAGLNLLETGKLLVEFTSSQQVFYTSSINPKTVAYISSRNF